MPEGRLLPWQVETGRFNMAADRWLLDQRVAFPERGPILRFYGWKDTTLSLGYHQSPIYPAATLEAMGIRCVRRPTGGRAVLHQASAHQAELTYSLIVPDLEPRSRREAYAYLCQFLWNGLNNLGVQLDPLGPSPSHHREETSRTYHHRASCFATATSADLTFQQRKLIGSAQLWKQQVVLQQGSLLLRPDIDLWERVLPGSTAKIKGLQEIAPQPLEPDQMINSLSQSAAELLGVTWQEAEWSNQEREAITALQDQGQG